MEIKGGRAVVVVESRSCLASQPDVWTASSIDFNAISQTDGCFHVGLRVNNNQGVSTLILPLQLQRDWGHDLRSGSFPTGKTEDLCGNIGKILWIFSECQTKNKGEWMTTKMETSVEAIVSVSDLIVQEKTIKPSEMFKCWSHRGLNAVLWQDVPIS